MIVKGYELLYWDSEGSITLYDLEIFVMKAYGLFVNIHSKDEHLNDAYPFYLKIFTSKNSFFTNDDWMMSQLSSEDDLRVCCRPNINPLHASATFDEKYELTTYVETLVPNYEKLEDWSRTHEDYLSYLDDCYVGKWRTYEDISDSEDSEIRSLSDLDSHFDPGFCEDLVSWGKKKNKRIDEIGYEGVRDFFHEFLLSSIWINWKKEGILKSVTSCYIKYKLEQLRNDPSARFTEEIIYLVDNKLKQQYIDFMQKSRMRWLSTLEDYYDDSSRTDDECEDGLFRLF